MKCFFIEPTSKFKRFLRRYVYSENGNCLIGGYHNGMSFLDIVEIQKDADGIIPVQYAPAHDLEGWPKNCKCGYEFKEEDNWQLFVKEVYKRVDTGEETTLDDAAPGAMWYADWYPTKGPDGRSLMVKCPDGRLWNIDGRASNCTKPEDKEHRCWVRHGSPPNITVDKNGLTCAAGAGSIQTGGWHGFLRNGIFEKC